MPSSVRAWSFSLLWDTNVVPQGRAAGPEILLPCARLCARIIFQLSFICLHEIDAADPCFCNVSVLRPGVRSALTDQRSMTCKVCRRPSVQTAMVIPIRRTCNPCATDLDLLRIACDATHSVQTTRTTETAVLRWSTHSVSEQSSAASSNGRVCCCSGVTSQCSVDNRFPPIFAHSMLSEQSAPRASAMSPVNDHVMSPESSYPVEDVCYWN